MGALSAVKWFCAFAMTFLSAQSLAAGFDDEYEEKTWSEIEVQLPAFPEHTNLIQFQVGALAGTKYMIDGASLSMGSDDVLRYTLVVISSTGAQNISYEGMRCATAERRFYAFGQSDKTWSKAKSNKWVRIRGSSNNHHVELYTSYFCSAGAGSIRDADDAIRVLRQGGRR